MIKFFKLVLAASLSHSVRLKLESIYDNVFKAFNRVFVQDSTTIPLPSKLAEYFPGSRNYTQVQSATMKIQSIFDLATERFFHFGINTITKNDQRASVDILPFIQAGDLVIRDLGYSIISVLRQIQCKGAYFLSRLKYGLVLHQTDGTIRIDLLKILNTKQAADIYKLRWRIEIIFKSWKSHFCLANVPKANVFRVKSYVYALLIFITIFQTFMCLQGFIKKVCQRTANS